jgi:hypothetical protein
MDEPLYIASLRVASSVLTGIASALLIELPLIRTLSGLTYTTFLCILSIISAIQIERNIRSLEP